MRKTSISVSAAVCLGMAALVSQPQLARADDLSFPAQTLSESLRALGHQARINMLFDPALTGKVRAPAVTAAEGVEDALRQLLAGTGLTFRFIDERTVTVIPKDPRGAERTEADRSD
ncbi:MAG TPA: STN domain-containing protein, partial [Steroidobacteraceae bacterium]